MCLLCFIYALYYFPKETVFMDTIYFRRKIDQRLLEWFESKGHSPALVYGIRQCGKSKSIKQFAESHFKYVNFIDFWKTPNAKIAFEESLEVDTITKFLTGLFPSFKFVPHETVLIFDEIQDCPKARLSLKSFKEDGRYEVIASGSYIGLNIDSSGVPKPNGSEDFLEMKTMDFEEFLWAMGYDDNFIGSLLEYFKNKTEVPKAIHLKMKQLFNEYVCVGGYPEVLVKFINTNNFSEAFNKVKSLVADFGISWNSAVNHGFHLPVHGIEIYRSGHNNSISFDHLIQNLDHIIVLYAFVSAVAYSATATITNFFIVEVNLFNFLPCLGRTFGELVAERVRIAAFAETG